MPKIRIEKVISFSSEDPVHVANNILSNDPSRKWKCQTQGEKSASLLLQLEKASVISSIDIGNENSAYIEVLVNRSSSDESFKVLLVMSSFMGPLEARQSTNANKVRMFTKDQLSNPECDEKWDRVKVVCTQPFNRHVQYGLSFITFHTPAGNAASSSVCSIVGKFAVRPDSPDNLSAGSLFARRKELQENTPLKAAAAIREASSSALQSPTTSTPTQKKFQFSSTTSSNVQGKESQGSKRASRNRDELLYAKDEEEPNKKIDYLIEQKTKEIKDKKEKDVSLPIKKESQNRNDNHNHNDKNKGGKPRTTPKQDELSVKPGPSKTRTDTSKRKLNGDKNTPSKKVKGNALCKPFSQLLDGVVLVISGIQNPDRAKLRTMALSLGAKYKPDWDDSCTHLICAFPNTPKFNQVKGKGKIITKKWIMDCHSDRKRLPWRRYALDKSDKGRESEDEICEQTEEPTNEPQGDVEENVASTSKITNSSDTEDERVQTPQKPDNKDGSDTEDEIESKKILEKTNEKSGSDNEDETLQERDSSGADTEDEIERIQKLQNRKVSQTQSDAFNVDTDEEQMTRSSSVNGHPSLPDFFSNKSFYIDPNLNKEEKHLLVKYITAFNGTLKRDLVNSIDIVITSAEWKPSLQNLSPSTEVVSSDFVWECHNNEKLIPVDDFRL